VARVPRNAAVNNGSRSWIRYRFPVRNPVWPKMAMCLTQVAPTACGFDFRVAAWVLPTIMS
jgi:hypothetical protein